MLDIDKYPFEIKLSKTLPLYKTKHFNIYYYPNSYAEKQIEAIAVQREKAYSDIALFLNTHIEMNMDLYLFNDAETKESETNHIGNGWAFANVMVEIYNETTKCHPYHELVHIFAIELYGNAVSLFSEGLAVYISEYFCNYDFGDYVNFNTHEKVKKFYETNRLFTLKEMFAFQIGTSISKPKISYPQAASIIKYIYGVLGNDKFYCLYKTLNADYPDEGIEKNIFEFEKCMGKPVEQVYDDWLTTIV